MGVQWRYFRLELRHGSSNMGWQRGIPQPRCLVLVAIIALARPYKCNAFKRQLHAVYAWSLMKEVAAN